ncbi:MAG: class II fructose-bisphosphate aldolase [Clostridia bacterium]|nr:class II fructose-bisphosphate aldolase [Clostridia bacterium]
MALYTMKEILKDAQEKNYGVGFFNTYNMDMTRSVIRAAEEANSPVIIGTAESLLKYGPFDWIMPMMLEQARNAKVPVAVHLDHGYSFDIMMQALKHGCGSIMYDGTREESHAENVRKSAELARICHAMGVGLECELGSVGGLSDETGNVDHTAYTDPNDAREFIEQTGADFLAVSIGTQHGVYKATPKLDLNRLAEIHAAVDVPLVLHGGSGLSDDDFRNTVKGGIRKVNVFTDVILAAKAAIHADDDESYGDALNRAMEAMTAAVAAKIQVFGSAGKA